MYAFCSALAKESALEQGDLGATAEQGQLSWAIIPTQPSPPVWEAGSVVDRFGRSALEVIGQTLLLTQGSLQQQPGSLPGLELLVELSTPSQT